MNDLLQVKANFEQKKNSNGFSVRRIPSNKIVDVSDLQNLNKQLKKLFIYCQNNKLINKVLITAYYTEVVAKSNRIQGLLSEKGFNTNDLIVGAKFSKDKEPKHIITYCLSKEALKKNIEQTDEVITILQEKFDGTFSNEQIHSLMQNEIDFSKEAIAKTTFIHCVADAAYLEKFDIELVKEELRDNQIVTLYETGTSNEEILRKLNINLLQISRLDSNTFLLTPDQYNIIKDNAPYLIAMSVNDMNELRYEDIRESEIDDDIPIPLPKNEPIIGVIDTAFETEVYFSKWVDYRDMIDPNFTVRSEDKDHGTMVSSIIVDGPTHNRKLDDGCGRFRVRHFGVVTGKRFSAFSLLRKIKEIVTSNLDIKVWNLCLGSESEIEDNFISPLAALLDDLQYEHDVIFVVAGTNKTNKNQQKIGSPADSINSVVVNSVSFYKVPASYTRKGPVLSFFTKPDVSYYGGDTEEKIGVYYGGGKVVRVGTSFAAPWIARKLAYMMQVMGLSREVSKALLIDSAAGWNKSKNSNYEIGFGIVPIKIIDILQTKDDEIRFFMTGVSEQWDTYNYNIPVPSVNDTYPFIAKATLCYFPKCFRNQGVDYTTTELDLGFGRITDKNNMNKVNENIKSEQDNLFTKESKARNLFRKWDNIKHVGEFEETKHRLKKVYKNRYWGVSLKTTERLPEKYGKNLKFGVVITLKEINGKNRIEDFIQQCKFKGMLVNRITIENQISVYNKAQEEIEFE